MKAISLVLACLVLPSFAAPIGIPADGLIPESHPLPSTMESISTSRLPLIEPENTSVNGGAGFSTANFEVNNERFTSRNTPRRRRGFRRSFSSLFRRGRNTGMSFDEFVATLGSKVSCHSVAGIDIKKVLDIVESVHSSPVLDRIRQRPCSDNPSWWDDDIDEGLDKIPLLDSTER